MLQNLYRCTFYLRTGFSWQHRARILLSASAVGVPADGACLPSSFVESEDSFGCLCVIVFVCEFCKEYFGRISQSFWLFDAISATNRGHRRVPVRISGSSTVTGIARAHGVSPPEKLAATAA